MSKNYTFMKGTFHVVGYSPDGDSMMFKAQDEARWSGWNIVRNPKDRGAVQLRLLGVDALETHYSPDLLVSPEDVVAKETEAVLKVRPKCRKCKQPSTLAKQAAEEFMKLMGVTQAHWKPVFDGHYVDWAIVQNKGNSTRVDTKLADSIEGYIVTNGTDKNGRPLAWVFAGKKRYADGKSLQEKDLISLLAESANYKLLQTGLVYPYFFKTLNEKALEIMAGVAQEATKKKNTIWEHDKTTKGVKITTIKMLEDEVIFPDLFRKVVKGWYGQNMQTYWNALRSGKDYNADPEKTKISVKDMFGPDSIFKGKDDGTILMKKQPWEVVFP